MKKKAFSLFELILVVILIGLVYSLVLDKINIKKNIHIKELKSLKKLLPLDTKLIVYDRCQKQNIKIDNIFKNIKVYTVENDSLKEVEFAPYQDKNGNIYDVCLRFQKFQNGSITPYIIKQNDNYVVFYPYFKEPEKFSDAQSAIDAFLETKLLKEFKDEY